MNSDEKQKIQEAIDCIEQYNLPSHTVEILKSLITEPQEFYPGQRVLRVCSHGLRPSIYLKYLNSTQHHTVYDLGFDDTFSVPTANIKPDPDAPFMVEVKKHDGSRFPPEAIEGRLVRMYYDDGRQFCSYDAAYYSWNCITHYCILPQKEDLP